MASKKATRKKAAKKPASKRPEKAPEEAKKPAKAEADEDEDDDEDEDEPDETKAETVKAKASHPSQEEDDDDEDEDDEDDDDEPAPKPEAKKPASKPSKKAAGAKHPGKAAKAEASGGGKGGSKAHGDGGGEDKGPKENLRLGELGPKVMQAGIGLGVVGLGAAAGLALGADMGGMKRFLHAYLIAFWFGLAITLGALFFVLVQHLTRSQWSVTVRRVAEVFAGNVWLFAILALPIIVLVLTGDHTLYRWNDPEAVAKSHLLHHKEPYLNAPFFAARWVFYFAVWTLLGHRFLTSSAAQDKSGDTTITKKNFAVAAPGMVLFALSITFAAIDTLMSLEPEWFSTIFGVYVFAGAHMSFQCFLALVLMFLQKNGRLEKSVNPEHYHDLGKMAWAFVIFWSYIAFSQFMLIWYADIPEETHWYHVRSHGGWLNWTIVLAVGHFVIPLFGMISRWTKRSKPQLGFWCVWLLCMEFIDLFWLVMPSYDAKNPPMPIVEICAAIGVLGLTVGVAAWRAGGYNLRPTRDPRLHKSLAFEQF